MSGDYTWDQMPEPLAQLLYAATEADPAEAEFKMGDVLDWVFNDMKTCAATTSQFTSIDPQTGCLDMPVPGSEFCKRHMPKEDLDG